MYTCISVCIYICKNMNLHLCILLIYICILFSFCVLLSLSVYTSGTRAQVHTQRVENIYSHLYIHIYIAYIYVYITCCLLRIAIDPFLGFAPARGVTWQPWRHLQVWEIWELLMIRIMRHGHEMLRFSRGSFSESELPLSCNLHSRGSAGGCN